MRVHWLLDCRPILQNSALNWDLIRVKQAASANNWSVNDILENQSLLDMIQEFRHRLPIIFSVFLSTVKPPISVRQSYDLVGWYLRWIRASSCTFAFYKMFFLRIRLLRLRSFSTHFFRFCLFKSDNSWNAYGCYIDQRKVLLEVPLSEHAV